jgi:hypothetical protein
MDTNEIINLRPQAATSAEIKASLQRIDAVIVSIEAMVTDATSLRNSLLLSGSVAAIRAAETALAEARINQEQLAALKDSVSAQLPIAERSEKVARLRASVENSNTLTRAMCERFRTEYPPLAAALASLLKDEVEAIAARMHCTHAWFRNEGLAREAGVPLPIGPDLLPHGCQKGSYHELIAHLPGIAPWGDTASHDMYLRFFPAPQQPEPPPGERKPDPRPSMRSTNPGREVRFPGTPVPPTSAAGYDVNYYGEFG